MKTPDSLLSKLLISIPKRKMIAWLQPLYYQYPKVATVTLLLLILLPVHRVLTAHVKPWIPEGQLAYVYLSCMVPIGIIGLCVITHFLPRIFILPRPRGKIYQSVGAEEPIKNLFDRSDLECELEERLANDDNLGLLVISGESGSGKSTLIRDILVPKLEQSKDWYHPVVIKGFLNEETFKGDIRRGLEPIFQLDTNKSNFLRIPLLGGVPSKRVLVVFDQFEQFMLFREDNSKLEEWLIELMREFKKHKVQCLIVVRKEYYYDLRFIANLLDVGIFENTIWVSVIEFGDIQNKLTADTLEKLQKVVNDVDLYRIIRKDLVDDRKALPLEIQMIGLMIEDMKNQELALRKIEKCKSLTQAKKYHLSKRYLIRRYFIRHIFCTTDQNAAMAILFALSSQKTSMTRFDASSLSNICHIDAHSTEMTAEQLRKSGLIKLEQGEYYLPHDYLSERYYLLTGELLDPIQRDNIACFADLHKRLGKQKFAEIVTDVTDWEFPALIDWLFIGIFIFLFLRLSSPIVKVFNWSWVENHFFDSATRNYYGDKLRYLDLDYLPSFIASCISSWYVWTIHRNFILRIRHNKLLTLIVIAFSVLAIISGLFVPHAWLLFASSAGALIAARLYISLSDRRGDSNLVLNNSPSNDLKLLALFTLASMFISFVIGLFIAYSFYCWSDRMDYVKQIAIIEVFLSLLYFVFLAICCRKHTSKYRGSILLGLWDRHRMHLMGGVT